MYGTFRILAQTVGQWEQLSFINKHHAQSDREKAILVNKVRNAMENKTEDETPVDSRFDIMDM